MIVREEKGLYVVTNKRVENSDKFRQAAIKFQTDGFYTAAPRGTSAYISYWREEGRRCIEGYVAPDGDWISGYHYFYLNYSPILKVTEKQIVDGKGHKRKLVERVRDFPDFWDSDYDYFHAIDIAETEGKHLAVLKARGKGYSFKGSSMLCRNFFLIRDSKSYAIASGMEFLTKDGLLSKAWEIMDFVNEHTGWAKKRQKINQSTHKRASYVVTDDRGVESERGYMSEIMGVSLNNDSDKARGKRGKLILWEEGGKFPDLVKAWQVAQPSVEQNGVAHGLMIVFGTGGCVCEGTKVWDNEGNLCNIEDLKQDQGILGFNKGECSKEDITYIQDTVSKPCYRITTNTGRSIECSEDHPLLTAIQEKETKGNILGRKFVETEKVLIGNKVAVIDEVPFFSSKEMWEPRLVGWLIGDGTYGKKQSPRLSNCESEINSYIEENFKFTTQIERLTKDNKVYKETLIKGIIYRLRELGIYGQTKLNKTLPDNIHSYSYDTICELLGGLFDTDGYINLRYNKKRNTPIAEISISSASETLLNEIRFLLQRLGIHGRIKERLPRENNTIDVNSWFEFTISDVRSLLKFQAHIKLFPKTKQERLDKIGEVYSNIAPNIFYKGVRYETVKRKEYIGIRKVYNLTANTTHTYIANGIITHNTDDSDYEGLKELFLYPDGYNILPFKNIWDDGGTKCGFFVPEYVNMYGTDDNGHLLMDKDGNTDYHIAIRHAIAKREQVLKGANDRNAIDRWVAEHPFNPTEACLQISGNIFPKEELVRHLAFIRTREDVSGFKQVGELEWDQNGVLKWVVSHKPKDIVKYRLGKDDNKRGQIVIWEHPAVDAPHGLYIAGCLLPGEKVVTNEGLLNVEDVNYTNRLIDKDGDLVNIKALLRYDKENEDTYTLKMSNTYRTTTFTKEHPIYVSDHSLDKQNLIKEDLFNFDFKKVSEVKIGDWVKYPNTYFDENKEYSLDEEYGKMRDPEHWWFRGLWLGDGWCSKNNIYICFDYSNDTQIKRFEEYVKKYYNKNVYKRIRNNTIECCFSDKWLSNDLLKFGRYASGKFIPEHIKYEEDEIKKNLLLGFLDSDGCVYKDKRNYISLEFVSMNLKLLEDFQDIAFSLGLVGNLSKLRDEGNYNIEGRIGKQHAAYHLRFGHADSIKFANMCNFDIRSKLSKINKEEIKLVRSRPKSGCFLSADNKYIYIQIKDIIKSSYTGVVYNFETETHSFCTHHIPTHNCDPYDHDQATTSDSLGSVFIYKRFQNFESNYDILVAEYTGRPDTVNEFYENVRKLLIYYNARLLYENEKPGLFAYFINKHSEHLLADQPEIIKNILKDSVVRRSKGIHMTTGIKDFAELKVRDWLNEEYEPGKKNLTKILSEPLTEELISFNREGNFDRVIAFMLVMIFKEELHNRHVKKPDDENTKKELFIKPLFTRTDIPRFIDL